MCGDILTSSQAEIDCSLDPQFAAIAQKPRSNTTGIANKPAKPEDAGREMPAQATAGHGAGTSLTAATVPYQMLTAPLPPSAVHIRPAAPYPAAAPLAPAWQTPAPSLAPLHMNSHTSIQQFTSAVAAAAAAGAMAAIQQHPSTHSTGLSDQQAAFAAAASAAAAAAASQAVSLISSKPPWENFLPGAALHAAQPPHALAPNAWAASPPTSAPQRFQAAPYPPVVVKVTPAGAGAGSDGSEHQPSDAPLPGSNGRAHASPAQTPAASESGRAAPSRSGEASQFELALVKRLQLYAWLVGNHGRKVLQQSLDATANRYAARAHAAADKRSLSGTAGTNSHPDDQATSGDNAGNDAAAQAHGPKKKAHDPTGRIRQPKNEPGWIDPARADIHGTAACPGRIDTDGILTDGVSTQLMNGTPCAAAAPSNADEGFDEFLAEVQAQRDEASPSIRLDVRGGSGVIDSDPPQPSQPRQALSCTEGLGMSRDEPMRSPRHDAAAALQRRQVTTQQEAQASLVEGSAAAGSARDGANDCATSSAGLPVCHASASPLSMFDIDYEMDLERDDGDSGELL